MGVSKAKKAITALWNRVNAVEENGDMIKRALGEETYLETKKCSDEIRAILEAYEKQKELVITSRRKDRIKILNQRNKIKQLEEKIRQLKEKSEGNHFENKRKIIEIYVTENEEEDTISFEFEKVEDSEVANSTMKGILNIFVALKDAEDELTVRCSKDETNI